MLKIIQILVYVKKFPYYSMDYFIVKLLHFYQSFHDPNEIIQYKIISMLLQLHDRKLLYEALLNLIYMRLLHILITFPLILLIH